MVTRWVAFVAAVCALLVHSAAAADFDMRQPGEQAVTLSMESIVTTLRDCGSGATTLADILSAHVVGQPGTLTECLLQLQIESEKASSREHCCQERDKCLVGKDSAGLEPKSNQQGKLEDARHKLQEARWKLKEVRAMLLTKQLEVNTSALERRQCEAQLDRTKAKLGSVQDEVARLQTLLAVSDAQLGSARRQLWVIKGVGILLLLLGVLRQLAKRFRLGRWRAREVSFDHMIPSFDPLLVRDDENTNNLYACVPIRTLPPAGRGAPLTREGIHGAFIAGAVRRAKTRHRRLVVIAYANCQAAPTTAAVKASYELLCRQSAEDIPTENIVFVWHDVIQCLDEELATQIESARWRPLFSRQSVDWN